MVVGGSGILQPSMAHKDGGRPTQCLLEAFVRVWDAIVKVFSGLFGLVIAIYVGAMSAQSRHPSKFAHTNP